jgi:hypothetical protein
MPQNNYLEPIEKEDLDMKNKFSAQGARLPDGQGSASGGQNPESSLAETQGVLNPEKEAAPAETPPSQEIGPSGLEKEVGAEVQEEKVGEKIETARKTIQTHKPGSAAAVSDDANTVAGISEYEKKVDKLVELALQKGPEHAIKVAQHMDTNDNYTLDELHDRMIEDDLRKQLIQKGLLKEL